MKIPWKWEIMVLYYYVYIKKTATKTIQRRQDDELYYCSSFFHWLAWPEWTSTHAKMMLEDDGSPLQYYWLLDSGSLRVGPCHDGLPGVWVPRSIGIISTCPKKRKWSIDPTNSYPLLLLVSLSWSDIIRINYFDWCASAFSWWRCASIAFYLLVPLLLQAKVGYTLLSKKKSGGSPSKESLACLSIHTGGSTPLCFLACTLFRFSLFSW
jgi:hypothetical protein